MHVPPLPRLHAQVALDAEPLHRGVDGLLAGVGPLADVPLEAAVPQGVDGAKHVQRTVRQAQPHRQVVVEVIHLLIEPVKPLLGLIELRSLHILPSLSDFVLIL